MSSKYRCRACGLSAEFDAVSSDKRACPNCGGGLTAEHRPPPLPRRRRSSDDSDEIPVNNRRTRLAGPRRSKAKYSQRNIVLAVIVLALGLLGSCGGIIVFWAWPGSSGSVILHGRSAPPGFTAIRDSSGGFAVNFPGDAKQELWRAGGGKGQGSYFWIVGGYPFDDSPNGQSGYAKSLPLEDGDIPGTTPAELFQLAKRLDWPSDIDEPSINEILSKKAIVLDGKPALEVRFQDKVIVFPEHDETWKKINREKKEQFEKTGKRGVYLVALQRRNLIVMRLVQKGRFPDEQTIDQIKQSFRFLN